MSGSHASARLALIAAATLFSTGGAAIKATSLTGWQVASFRSAVAAVALALFLPGARARWTRGTMLVGAAYAARHADCLATLGRHVVIGLLGGAKADVDLGRLLARRQSLIGMKMRTRPVADKIAVTERFRREWLHRFDDARLVPVVDSVYPLADAAKAHSYMETNANVGKIVLSLRN